MTLIRLPVLLSVLSLGCGQETVVKPPDVLEGTIDRDDGSEFRFTVSVPGNYAEDVPTPMIVVLHYGGPVTPFYGREILEILVAPALNELNAIIVPSSRFDWQRLDERN